MHLRLSFLCMETTRQQMAADPAGSPDSIFLGDAKASLFLLFFM